MQAELKQKVSQDQKQKQRKAKEGFKGLQASERPIVLPGGRKWRNEKDAFNEEMIAEIISSQAELIMGTTLGYSLPISFIYLVYVMSINFNLSLILKSHFHYKFYRNAYESPILGYDNR